VPPSFSFFFFKLVMSPSFFSRRRFFSPPRTSSDPFPTSVFFPPFFSICADDSYRPQSAPHSKSLSPPPPLAPSFSLWRQNSVSVSGCLPSFKLCYFFPCIESPFSPPSSRPKPSTASPAKKTSRSRPPPPSTPDRHYPPPLQPPDRPVCPSPPSQRSVSFHLFEPTPNNHALLRVATTFFHHSACF